MTATGFLQVGRVTLPLKIQALRFYTAWVGSGSSRQPIIILFRQHFVLVQLSAPARSGPSKSPTFNVDMLVRTSITMCLVAACGPILAQADKAASCDPLVRNAVADEVSRVRQADPRERELCFPGQQDCLDQGGLAAEDIWKRTNNPDE